MSSGVPFAWRPTRVRAAGTTLAAFEAGATDDTAPVCVLLHGLGHWSGGAWGALVPRFAPALRCIALDLPGFGASGKPQAVYDLPYFRDALTAFADAYGLRRFAVVGHSLGGAVAAAFAGAHADRVSRMVLIAPAGFVRPVRYAAFALAARLARRIGVPRPPRALVAATLRRGLADPATLDPALLASIDASLADPALRRTIAGVYAGALRDWTPAFAGYGGPVLCAWGRHDRYLGVDTLRAVRRTYPAAATLILERSGHLPALEEPATLAAAISAFLLP